MSGVKQRARGLLQRVRAVLGGGFMALCHRVRGVDPRKVVFSSFGGHAYSDNPRAVSEALREICPEAKIVWHLSRHAAGRQWLPDYVRTAPPRTPAILYHYATARVIVDNLNRPQYMRTWPDQCYVQTWHGDRGVKKCMFDMDDGVDYPDARYMSAAVSGSAHANRFYASAFRYRGRLLEVGSPRNDVLLDPPEGLAHRVREALGVPEGDCLLLYAPTFRNRTWGGKQPAALDMDSALRALEAATGKPWTGLVRGHYLNSGVKGSGVRDVSGYPEMSHLLLVADALITDYSSSMGDFVLTGRPTLLFQPDREVFRSEDREFYYDLDKTPLWIARDQQELEAFFTRFGEAEQNCREVLDFFGAFETGHASASVAEYVAEQLRRPAAHRASKQE